MTAPRFTVYRDAAGEWRWRLVATNGRTIADSGEGYVNRQDCIDAIVVVRVFDKEDDDQ